MAPSLVTMPPEIRCMIYDWVFFSPTNTLEPLSRSECYSIGLPIAVCGKRPKFLLATENHSQESNITFFGGHDDRTSSTSLSLLRVNKLFATEAKHHFYTKNTLYFANSFRLSEFLQNTMWPATQLIKHVSLSLNRITCISWGLLTRAFRLLEKRTHKHSAFNSRKLLHCTLRTATIVLTHTDLLWISRCCRRRERWSCLQANIPVQVPFFDDIYLALHVASQAMSGVRKLIRVVGVEDQRGFVEGIWKGDSRIAETVYYLSQIWGGSLVVGEEFLWEDVENGGFDHEMFVEEEGCVGLE